MCAIDFPPHGCRRLRDHAIVRPLPLTMAVMPAAESVTSCDALEVSDSPMCGMRWMNNRRGAPESFRHQIARCCRTLHDSGGKRFAGNRERA